MSCPMGGREGAAATDRKSECGRQFKRDGGEREEVGKNEFVLRINPGNKSQLSVSLPPVRTSVVPGS